MKISQLSKSYFYHQKEPGLLGSIKSLFYRKKLIKHALKNINLNLSEGEIIGLIGANGAGKTTLVKILAGIIHPDEGDVSILGYTPWERNNIYRKQMSLIMGQKAQVWWDLPALDSFTLLKEIYQIPDEIYYKNLENLSQKLQIKDQLKVQVRKLSLGERMKIELIAALLHNPKVIFLDEPTIGLDISAQKAIRKFILEYQSEFKPMIILTSHYMEDIKELCKRVVIMKDGQIVFDGLLADIQARLGDHKIIHLTTVEEISSPLCESLELIKKNELQYEIHCAKDLISSKIKNILENINVEDININDPGVDNIIESIMKNGPLK